MATHIFVNPNVTKPAGDIAQLHVASDPPVPVTITVFPSGKQETLQMNEDGFAISSDLFAMTGGKAALVVATTDDPQQPSTVFLRQKLNSDRLASLIPSEDKAAGTVFVFPLEFLADGASLYIANAGPAEAVGVLQYGTPRSPVATQRLPGGEADQEQDLRHPHHHQRGERGGVLRARHRRQRLRLHDPLAGQPRVRSTAHRR
jgi:hypothetical protein